MAHRLSLQARADLVEVWEYLYHATGDTSVADRQIDAFMDRFVMLSNWPRMGRARGDLRPGLRGYPVGNYTIFYQIVHADIVVQRVLHNRRNIRALIGR
jgi:toxin ParE1/3/4